VSPNIYRTSSVSQLCEDLYLPVPLHPLITVIDVSKMRVDPEHIGQKMVSDLYYIALKDHTCGPIYGRQHCDFPGSVLSFFAPNIVFELDESTLRENHGWMLVFHPDLIRKSALGESIEEYTFFSYHQYEALHLSEEEEATLNDCVDKIVREYQQRIDNHSQRVMVATLELLLSYCLRYYERQFNTRSTHHKDIVVQVDSLLSDYAKSGKLAEQGAPSLQYLADHVHLSTGYLSDLLRKETGHSGKDHINEFLIGKAKGMLLRTTASVSEIAYDLGFNYPHYFSRLFKAKTGHTPHQYRSLN